ncbi:hypothetical protein ISN44_As12g015150 [Arabidopsis suecica]|uniref:Uncharacterized protein n=1 Tax=Arabidopsis suecica TaxID=45249 RepID=A0A8T1YJ52_ARASU|nr:hypothetical protein ISN44_As12g015150 [Arabidopsis suecica]
MAHLDLQLNSGRHDMRQSDGASGIFFSTLLEDLLIIYKRLYNDGDTIESWVRILTEDGGGPRSGGEDVVEEVIVNIFFGSQNEIENEC